ncbi:MAG: hypothetical protein HZA34_03235 [Candidatus Pacebacteria bacterium]|nr:hypothetical protein [Candidatus Paceibacterota bacterium]
MAEDGRETQTTGSLTDTVGALYKDWFSGIDLEAGDLATVQKYVREVHNNNVAAAAEALNIPVDKFKSFAGLNAFS